MHSGRRIGDVCLLSEIGGRTVEADDASWRKDGR